MVAAEVLVESDMIEWYYTLAKYSQSLGGRADYYDGLVGFGRQYIVLAMLAEDVI